MSSYGGLIKYVWKSIYNEMLWSHKIRKHYPLHGLHTALLWPRGFCNSVKLWAMPCRATQDRQVIVKSSDKTWSSGGGNGKPLQYSCYKNPWTVWKGKKIWHWKMNSPGWEMSSMLLGRTEGNHGVAKSQTGLTDWTTMIGSKALQEIYCSFSFCNFLSFKEKHNINDDPMLRIIKKTLLTLHINDQKPKLKLT